MIIDSTVKQEIQAEWDGVKKMYKLPEAVSRPVGLGRNMVILTTNPAPPEFYNLPFFLAYSVLDSVLSQLVQEQVFVCKHWMLGRKMEASKVALTWTNYLLVDEGRNLRNSLAHAAQLLNREECIKYIKAIETELLAWHVIT